MIVEPTRRAQELIFEREKSLFQQMVEDRLALAEQARQCASQKEGPSAQQDHEASDDEMPVIQDTKLIGLHLEQLGLSLDETRKQAERTLRRLQQVMARVERGQREALAALRSSLGELTGLEVVEPRPVVKAERQDILRSMALQHGAELPPEGSVFRLYREEDTTSFFVLSDGRVLALQDGTIGSAEDKDDLIALVKRELHAQEAVFTQGIDDLKSTLDQVKQRFASQLNAVSTTLKMQRV
ncbi:hypothetical protein [Microvirga massiliensis]|uniref:hypothetical protein n=1 Tax=Microvirga massiliensis TaxID=1033741 RepID=UPI00062B8021|nr:hypothetical protein [Microvirga massiliensis]